VPVAVGTPEIEPFAEFSLSPGGNFPPDSLKVSGSEPPVTVILFLTCDPAVTGGSVVVVIDKGACADKLARAPHTKTNHNAGANHCDHIRIMLHTL
jgi:hypothetical protein